MAETPGSGGEAPPLVIGLRIARVRVFSLAASCSMFMTAMIDSYFLTSQALSSPLSFESYQQSVPSKKRAGIKKCG